MGENGPIERSTADVPEALATPAPAGLPRWWTQDQVVLQQLEIKAESYYAGDTGIATGTAAPIDSSVPSNWWRRESGVLQQESAGAAAILQTAEPPTLIVPTVEATPGLPTWWKRQSSALLDVDAAAETNASTHVTPTSTSQKVATESAAPALSPAPSPNPNSNPNPNPNPKLSPLQRLKEWLKNEGLPCAAPRSNKSYGCLKRATVP